jgi:hypothetical protein
MENMVKTWGMVGSLLTNLMAQKTKSETLHDE